MRIKVGGDIGIYDVFDTLINSDTFCEDAEIPELSAIAKVDLCNEVEKLPFD